MKMLSINLVQAEWLKIRGSWLLWALLAVFPVLGLVQAAWDCLDGPETASRVFPIPFNMELTLQGMNWYGPLLAAILAAWMFGEEYRRNLWSALLPRRTSRASFMVAKHLLCAGLLLCWLVICPLLSLITSWVGCTIYNLPTLTDGGARISPLMGQWSVIAMQTFLYAAVGATATILGRHPMAGFFAAFVPLKILEFASTRMGTLAVLSPTAHLSHMARWLNDFPLQHTWSLQFSVVVVLLWSAVTVLVGVAVFQYREVQRT